MIGQRSFPHNHSLALSVTALAVIVAAVLLGVAAAPETVKVAAPAVVVENDAPESARIAESERWAGLAQLHSQRAAQAEAARWEGITHFYQPKDAPVVADALRWTGLAQVYSQRGRTAETLRWTALAEVYARP